MVDYVVEWFLDVGENNGIEEGGQGSVALRNGVTSWISLRWSP
jgi:hypothetical protein